jgi:hypothetical protein
MEKAKCIYATSEAAGYPKENVLDGNLDTYWKPTSSGDKWINFDLGDSKSVSMFTVFFKNYKSISNGSIAARYSDNGTTWTYLSGFAIVATDTATPLRLKTCTAVSHRWWSLKFSVTSVVIEVAGVWFGSYYNIAQGNEYPEADADRFYNKATLLPGGRLGIAGINKNPSRLISRQYLFSGLTEFNKLRNAFLDSAGRRFPLVLNEGSSQSDAHLVRFANDEFAENETDHQLFQPSISFVELPYIDDGDSY